MINIAEETERLLKQAEIDQITSSQLVIGLKIKLEQLYDNKIHAWRSDVIVDLGEGPERVHYEGVCISLVNVEVKLCRYNAKGKLYKSCGFYPYNVLKAATKAIKGE